MRITRIFADACNVKLSECNDVLDHTGRYQVAFDTLASLISEDVWMSQQTIEMTLQGSLLRHLGPNYSALVSAIETGWTEDMTNLSNTILRVTRHAEVQKGNALDSATENAKIMVTKIHRAPKGTCTTLECVERGVTTHYNNRCWVKNPELCAKYSFRQMRPRGSNRSLRKVAIAEQKESTPPLKLES